MPPKRISLAARSAQDTTTGLTTPGTSDVPPVASALWSEEPARQEVVALDVTQLMPNRRQPRTIFNQDTMEELATSIREYGVIQPVIVRPIPLTKWEGHARRYELIAGERRWRASILAGQPTIPALIRTDAGDHETPIVLALIENLQRADLHPLEEALAFGVMRDELGYSYRKIAERVGRSKGYVENRLKLLTLDDDLQQLVYERPDTLMHVVELAKVSDPAARAALLNAVREGLSYPETQARVRMLLAPVDQAGTAEKVSLRKDTPGRQSSGDDSYAVADELSLRKDTLVRQSDLDHAPATGDPGIVSLSARERALLSELGGKLEQWLDNPALLSAADWKLLAPIALRLRDLLHRLDR